MIDARFIIHVSRWRPIHDLCFATWQVVVVPLEGDPDLYISFDTKLPSGATNATFVQVITANELII